MALSGPKADPPPMKKPHRSGAVLHRNRSRPDGRAKHGIRCACDAAICVACFRQGFLYGLGLEPPSAGPIELWPKMSLAVPCGSSGKGILAVQPAVTGNNTGSPRTLNFPGLERVPGPGCRFVCEWPGPGSLQDLPPKVLLI
jgi:hypothetical protein